jgi:hypothetical protein
MPKALKGTNKDGSDYYVIECPACGHAHMFDSRWIFNGDFEKPTFSPSMLSKSIKPKGYSNENPAPLNYDGEYENTICHSFVTDGKIEYLTDCTHEFAGKTIELEDI